MILWDSYHGLGTNFRFVSLQNFLGISNNTLTFPRVGSDPRAGTSPSVLNHNEILRSVSLYYLTRSFLSSVFIYYQNPNGFKTTYTKAKTDAPMLFSAFKYNLGFWPPALVALVGNLVSYKSACSHLCKRFSFMRYWSLSSCDR